MSHQVLRKYLRCTVPIIEASQNKVMAGRHRHLAFPGLPGFRPATQAVGRTTPLSRVSKQFARTRRLA